MQRLCVNMTSCMNMTIHRGWRCCSSVLYNQYITPHHHTYHRFISSKSSFTPDTSSPSPSTFVPVESPSSSPSSSPSYDYTQNARHRTHSRGPITWRSVAVLIVSSFVGVGIYQYEKERKMHAGNHGKTVGTPLLGGSYKLIDMYGKSVDSTIDYAGKYQLIYFGFTHCPDICPAELEKMQMAVKQFNDQQRINTINHNTSLIPIFISIDPRRDTCERLRQYSSHWSPTLQWLTGSDEQIKSVAKKFRVYYSSPEWAADGTDEAYLVDHSIFFYLMDRQGEFMQYFGKNMSAEDIALKMQQLVTQDNTVQ